MVFITRRIAPTALSPTDPGYEPDLQRRQQVLLADWTPAAANSHDENVEVYSNCEQVELFLNGKSLGEKARPADDSPRTWAVPFVPGTLKAVGKNKGRVAAAYELRTAGKQRRGAAAGSTGPCLSSRSRSAAVQIRRRFFCRFWRASGERRRGLNQGTSGSSHGE